MKENSNALKIKEIEQDIRNLVLKMKETYTPNNIQEIFYYFRDEFDSVMGKHSIDKIVEKL